jgi:hypothetical protein
MAMSEMRKIGRPKGSRNHKDLTPEEIKRQFWSHVKVGLPHECWPWTGYVERETGYGKFTWNTRPSSAHRFAWIATFGEIPFGLLVCHKCDNRVCQNPSHLWLGTIADNNRDMREKGRGAKPPRNDKITREEVKLVRKLWVPYKVSVRKISTMLKLPYKSVETAVSKTHWKEIPWTPS